jgi:hypothetical protein
MPEVHAETHVGRLVNCAWSSDFNQNWNLLTNCNKPPMYLVSWKPCWAIPVLQLHSDGHSAMICSISESFSCEGNKVFQIMILRFFRTRDCIHLRMFARILLSFASCLYKNEIQVECYVFFCVCVKLSLAEHKLKEFGRMFGPKTHGIAKIISVECLYFVPFYVTFIRAIEWRMIVW